MRSFRIVLCGWALGLAFCGVGCGKPPTTTATATPSAATNQVGGAPQPKLPTVKLWLGAKEIIAEMATTDAQRMAGMMFRTQMGEDEGMLFAFPRPHRTGFWMKNTLIPLSCAYLDSEGEILEIHDMVPKNETPIVAGSDRIVFVLETNKGWFERNKIGVGTVVRTEHGALKDSFVRQR